MAGAGQEGAGLKGQVVFAQGRAQQEGLGFGDLGLAETGQGEDIQRRIVQILMTGAQYVVHEALADDRGGEGCAQAGGRKQGGLHGADLVVGEPALLQALGVDRWGVAEVAGADELHRGCVEIDSDPGESQRGALGEGSGQDAVCGLHRRQGAGPWRGAQARAAEPQRQVRIGEQGGDLGVAQAGAARGFQGRGQQVGCAAAHRS